MHTKFERLLSKSLTTLEVMSYYLVVHTGPDLSKRNAQLEIDAMPCHRTCWLLTTKIRKTMTLKGQILYFFFCTVCSSHPELSPSDKVICNHAKRKWPKTQLSHAVRRHNSAIAMGLDDTVQPLPWGQMTQFSHSAMPHFQKFPEFQISENPSVPSGNPPEIRRTANCMCLHCWMKWSKVITRKVQEILSGSCGIPGHCHGVRWHSSATAMGSDDTVQPLPWGQMTQFSHCHGVRWWQFSHCHGVRWHSSAIAMGSDDTVQPFSDATFPEISGIPDIGKSVRPIRKPSRNPTNREFYVSTLLNEVVRSHHAESSGNFVRLLWHPWPLPWSQMTQFSHCHGVRWHSSAIAMGSDDTVQPLPWGQMTVQPLPWGQMTQFSHCHGVRWHSSAIAMGSDDSSATAMGSDDSSETAMGSDDTVQPLPWGQMTQFSHSHRQGWQYLGSPQDGTAELGEAYTHSTWSLSTFPRPALPTAQCWAGWTQTALFRRFLKPLSLPTAPVLDRLNTDSSVQKVPQASVSANSTSVGWTEHRQLCSEGSSSLCLCQQHQCRVDWTQTALFRRFLKPLSLPTAPVLDRLNTDSSVQKVPQASVSANSTSVGWTEHRQLCSEGSSSLCLCQQHQCRVDWTQTALFRRFLKPLSLPTAPVLDRLNTDSSVQKVPQASVSANSTSVGWTEHRQLCSEGSSSLRPRPALPTTPVLGRLNPPIISASQAVALRWTHTSTGPKTPTNVSRCTSGVRSVVAKLTLHKLFMYHWLKPSTSYRGDKTRVTHVLPPPPLTTCKKKMLQTKAWLFTFQTRLKSENATN